MAKGEIIQPIPQDKKAEIQDIVFDKRSERKKFIKKLVAEQQKHTTDHTPFCYVAAKMEFEKEQRDLFAKHGIRVGDRVDNVKVELDLKQYGDLKNFELLREVPITEHKLVDGMRTSVITGHWEDYRWKDGNYKVSVQVPLSNKPAKK